MQLGASKPVSSLLTTISSFMFAGSSMNRRLASSSYCLGGLAVLQDVLRVGVELVALVAVGGLARDRVVVRLVGGDDAAVRAEGGVLEQPVSSGRRRRSMAATRIAVPRSLFRRGLRLKSSMMSGDDALLALAGAHQLLHRRPALAQDRLLEVVQALGLLLEPRVDGRLRGEPLRHVAGLVLQVENDLVRHRLVELVGVDVGAEDIPRHLLVLAQERRAGEADEDRALQPALHLLVHVAALGAVAFVHEHVEPAVHGRRRAFQVGGVELVDRARTAGAAWSLRASATNSAREVMRGEGDSAPMTPAFFITPSICLSSSSRSVTTRMRASGSCSSSHLASSTIRMLLPLPWVCQMTPPSRLRDALLRGLHAEELVRPRHLLLAGIEDDEVADQVEQPRLVAHLAPAAGRAARRRRGTRPGRGVGLPLHEELSGVPMCRSAAPGNRCPPARTAPC